MLLFVVFNYPYLGDKNASQNRRRIKHNDRRKKRVVKYRTTTTRSTRTTTTTRTFSVNSKACEIDEQRWLVKDYFGSSR